MWTELFMQKRAYQKGARVAENIRTQKTHVR